MPLDRSAFSARPTYLSNPPMPNNANYRVKYIRSLPSYFHEVVICEQCAIVGDKIKWAHSIHHILPVSEGGTSGLRNLMALCARHHRDWHITRTPDIHTMMRFHDRFREKASEYYARVDELKSNGEKSMWHIAIKIAKKSASFRMIKASEELKRERDIAYQKYLDSIA